MKIDAWQPILTGDIAVHAAEVVQKIADDIQSSPELEDASLSRGHAGMSLFFEYLSQARPGMGHERTADRLLDRAITAVAKVAMGPGLYGGFPGVAWAAQHIQDRFRKLDLDEDINEEIDRALLKRLMRSPWPGEYDLVGGLVGMGVYALDRLPRQGASECLRRVIDRLAEIAEPQGNGLTLWTAPQHLIPETRAAYPQGYNNLGVAHGVPGVIALLGQCLVAEFSVETVRPLLADLLNWTWAQRLPDGGTSAFPVWVGRGLGATPTRSAWCYGDPGIAVSLLMAARAINDKTWEEQALWLGRLAAQRPPEESGVRDASLCHGTAGLGHIFNRLFHASGEVVFKDAARFWFQRTLDMRQAEGGLGTYRFLRPVGYGKVDWLDDPGILTGVSGVAMSLLAATTSIEPRWDRMLLMSLPFKRRDYAIS